LLHAVSLTWTDIFEGKYVVVVVIMMMMVIIMATVQRLEKSFGR
jgi:hypothetical protein